MYSLMALFKKQDKVIHEVLSIVFICPLVFILAMLTGMGQDVSFHLPAGWGTKLMAAESFLAILYFAAVNNDANYE